MIARNLTLALLATTAMGFIGVAKAADVYVPPVEESAYVPAPEAWSWTGIHFGVGGGGSFNFAEVDSHVFGDTGWDEFTHDLWSELGAVGGFATVEGGFDFQMGSFVLGIGANYDWQGKGASAAADSYWDDIDGDCNGEDDDCDYTYKYHDVTFGSSWAVTGRAGFAVTPQTLVYVLGGYTQAEISAYSEYDLDDDEYAWRETSAWRPGWVVGAGFEQMLGKSVSLKAEYRMSKFESFGYSTDDDINGNEHWLDVYNPVVHSIRGVLSYRWGMGQ